MARKTFSIFWREFSGFFYNPTAYVTMFGFLFINGMILQVELGPLRAGGDVDIALRSFFGNFFFWILMLSIPPIVTMRLLAEERRSGSVELLMTAPVRSSEVVLGKYAAGFLFTCFIWSLLLVDIGFLAGWLSMREPPVSLDWGKLGAVYIGIVSLEAFFLALGMFASALSRNQIVAAVVGLGWNIGVFFVGLYHQLFARTRYESLFLSYISVTSHFIRDFSVGIVDLRYIGLYLLGAAAALFLTIHLFESIKWR
jgi:ABC-2 type transport system permease protein